MPYVSTVERKLKEPCHNCAPPYGFRNDLPLTSDIKEFASKVKEANVSGNLDAPEGGFDAIMQVKYFLSIVLPGGSYPFSFAPFPDPPSRRVVVVVVVVHRRYSSHDLFVLK